MLTIEEYNDIVECIKFGCPAKAPKLILSLNNLIREADDRVIEKTQVTEQNNTEGDKK